MIKKVTRERFASEFQRIELELDVLNPYFSDAEAIAFSEDAEAEAAAAALFVRHARSFDVREIRDSRREGHYGHYKALLDALVSMANERNAAISLRFFEERPDCAALCGAALDAGFARLPGLCSAVSYADEALGRRWEDFKKRRSRFFERLIAKGCKNVPLTDIGGADRRALYDGIRKEYNYDAEAASRRVPADEENCFFTFRASRLAAFCFVLRASPTQMIFDFGGASEREKNSGVFLMPLSAFISRIYTYPAVQTAIYLFHENNTEMLNLAHRTLSIVIDSVKLKANYFYFPFGNAGREAERAAGGESFGVL
jgi:hypothetical protein